MSLLQPIHPKVISVKEHTSLGGVSDLLFLGTSQKIIYPNCEVFCSASRRNDKRIVNYVTVIATQKLNKRQSKMGKLFPVRCLSRARENGLLPDRGRDGF